MAAKVKMKKILFYDPDITGHHCEYLHHPATFLVNQTEVEGVIVCNAKIGAELIEIYGENCPQLRIELIQENLQESIDQADSLWRRGQADARCFAFYIEKHRPDMAIALHANPMQPFLNGGAFRRCKTRMRGILFDPFPLAERIAPNERTWKWRVTAFRKMCQIKWLSLNSRIEKLFVLNDTKVTQHFNALTGKRGLFEAIPDPLPLHLAHASSIDSGEEDTRVLRLLFIGSINRRKGLLETLNAIERLPAPVRARVSLRIVGRFLDTALREEAVKRVESLSRMGCKIDLCEGWVTDQQFSEEMVRCDVVLAPYVGFHGSSGVIGHAAFYRKPLLATCEGLVGELVHDRQIGVVVQTRDPEKYADAIDGFMTREWNYASQQAKYASEMSSSSFIRQLIS